MPGRRLSAAFCVAALVGLGACSDAREPQPSRDAERDLKQELLRRMPSGATLLYVAVGGVGAGAVSSGDVRLAWLSDEVFERSGLKGVYWAYVASGAAVSLSAAPWSGSTFSGWYGRTCSGTGSCVVVMNGNVDVGAQFEIAPAAPRTSFTLRVDVNGFVDGQIGAAASPVPPGGLEWNCTAFDKGDKVNTRRSCQATVPPGTVLSLTATPSPGTSFGGWGGGCAGAGPCVVTMDRDVSVTAMFASAQAPQPPAAYTVGGIVTGLLGGGLVLRNNAGDDLPVLLSGAFSFSTPLPGGAAYAVTVAQQPTNPGQTCIVSNGSGTVFGAVVDVAVTCTTDMYPVGGTVAGLQGSGLVLTNSTDGAPGEDLAISTNGAFTFPTQGRSGSVYAVAVRVQPSNPWQTCIVNGGAGLLASAVTEVAVTCTTNTYVLSGTVSGLAGSGLVLATPGEGNLAVVGGARSFTFPNALPSGRSYGISVVSQPTNPSQTCSVANGAGTVTSTSPAGIAVACTTNTYSVGGTISGLTGYGLVLATAGVPNLAVGAGAPSFAFQLPSGWSYGVTVASQPSGPSQTCSIANGTGVIGSSAVADVGVICTTNTYSVGGTVLGLTGSGLVLATAGEPNVTVDAGASSFAFANPLESGSSYDVTIASQPAPQMCEVRNGAGMVGGGAVGTVVIACCLAQDYCGGVCVDTQSNPNNCGACGHACSYGATCSDGTCIAAACPGATTLAQVSVPVVQPAPPGIAAGYGSYALAATDFNGDGRSDLVVTNNTNPGTVSVILNNGNGTFGSRTTYAVVNNPMFITVGDVNGDGRPDLVTGSNQGMSVLIGNGDGTFRPETRYTTSSAAETAVIADVDGDGRPDLVFGNSSGLSMKPGNGDGTFPSGYSVGLGGIAMYVQSIASADLDGDGSLDIVAGGISNGNGSIAVFLKNGSAVARYAADLQSIAVAIADVNVDGVPDIVSSNLPSGTIGVLLGSGDGTFNGQQSYSNGLGAIAIAVADLDDDGAIDLATANRGSPGTVSVLLGDGLGGLEGRTTYSAAPGSSSIAVADFDGDGRVDVATASNGAIGILFGRGDGTLPFPIDDRGLHPASIAIRDLNGDGRLDVVTANRESATVGVRVGNGDGTFGAQSVYAVGLQPYSVALADLNRDGIADVVTGNYLSNTLSVLLGRADGTLEPQAVYSSGLGPRFVVATDVDADGVPDVVVANYDANTVSILYGAGDGSLLAPDVYSAGSRPVFVAVGDVNGDARPDIVTANYGGGASGVTVLLGSASGSFVAGGSFGVHAVPTSVAIADLNGDGDPDLVVGGDAFAEVGVLLGHGNGTFGPELTFNTSNYVVSLAVADLNGDGHDDVVVVPGGWESVDVLMGSGDGTLGRRTSYGAGPYVTSFPSGVAVGDLDNDGRQDVVAAVTGGIAVFLTRCAP